VQKAMKAKEKAGDAMTEEERLALVATSQSLEMDPAEPRVPSNMSGLENFSLADDKPEEADESTLVDAESLFNLPESEDKEDEQPR